MANVWKIGSRWSPNGSSKSKIISIFRRSEVVFLGSKGVEKFHKEVNIDDYFAIADGYYIRSVAKVVSAPMHLNDMIKKNMIKVRQCDPFDITEDYSWCYGVKVKIVDLPKSECLYYEKRGTFFKANSIADKVVNLYEENLSHQFDIQANTYRIKSTHKQNDGKLSIIDNHTIFNIPVYQREYSWGREQICRFIGDIFKGFWGSDEEKSIVREPLFIGTMQLSYKKYISDREYEQDVIDGQQRLSTIICILQYLKLKYPNCDNIKSIKLNWFETRVNNGKEEQFLEKMLSLTSIDNISQEENFLQNKYLLNIQIIKEVFEELTMDDDEEEIDLFKNNIQQFVDYILNDIYFVIVETLAGLSKTIQIFNTINTAGLDLNGNDLFKVRLYEYLHDVNNFGEETFNEIGNIYKEIKDKNTNWRKNHNWDVITIETVRSIYKNYIISKYELSTVLYSKSTDTFFEELFDTLLNVQTHKDMNGVKNKNVKLSLDDIKHIIKVAYLWNSSDHRNIGDFISYTLIERSRYSRYTNIAYQILLSNENLPDEERFSQVYECLSSISKLFFCYSIMYAKAIYKIHSLMYDIYRLVVNYEKNKDIIASKIREYLKPYDNDYFRNNELGKVIAYNRTWKNLICILSDYFAEQEMDKSISIETLTDLYQGDFDIEHIHANADDNVDMEEDLQNSIGNLMLLEYDINRSIGAKPFYDKVHGVTGNKSYQDSNYATVKKIATYKQWNTNEALQRKEEETKKIMNFIFN